MTTITYFPLPRSLQPATPFISSVVNDDSSCMRPLSSKGICAKAQAILNRCLFMGVVAGAVTFDIILWTSRTILILPIYNIGLETHLEEIASIIATVVMIPAIFVGYTPKTVNGPPTTISRFPLPEWLQPSSDLIYNEIEGPWTETDMYSIPMPQYMTSPLIHESSFVGTVIARIFLAVLPVMARAIIALPTLLINNWVISPIRKEGFKNPCREIAALIATFCIAPAMLFGYLPPTAIRNGSSLVIHRYLMGGLNYALEGKPVPPEELYSLFIATVINLDAVAVETLITKHGVDVNRLLNISTALFPVYLRKKCIFSGDTLLNETALSIITDVLYSSDSDSCGLTKTCAVLMRHGARLSYQKEPEAKTAHSVLMHIRKPHFIPELIGYYPQRPFNPQNPPLEQLEFPDNLFNTLAGKYAQDVYADKSDAELLQPLKYFLAAQMTPDFNELNNLSTWLRDTIIPASEVVQPAPAVAGFTALETLLNSNRQRSACLGWLYSGSKFRDILSRLESLQQRLPQLQTEVTAFAIDHFLALERQLTVQNNSDKQTAAPKFHKDLWKLIYSYGLPHFTPDELRQLD
ncbi:MAG: hypothetical protein H0X51_07645 [Parachlamydiaceae bacterium]|nr:hypothetical protein [Parachlamydiaceae bacterium]